MTLFRTQFPSLVFVGLVFMAFGGSAKASVQFNIQGATDSLNNTATLTLSYVSSSDTAATLTLLAQNTSNFDALITGLGFNNPVSGLSSASLRSVAGTKTKNNKNWSVLFDPDKQNTPQPFGVFDLGVLSGNNLNGGSPQIGIEVNKTGVFVIDLTGTGLNDKSDAAFEEDFFNELSSTPKSNDVAVSAAVRFQQTGSNGEGSDVGTPYLNPQGAGIAPEPTGGIIWLALMAIVATRTARSPLFTLTFE